MPSARGVRIGTAEARPGELTYGHLDVLDHPNGIPERLPVLIAQGREDGPTLWLTANIHGAEYAGIPAIHRTMVAALPPRLRGTVIAMPSLNPAGLRTASRTAYYDRTDPNRTFPTRKSRPEAETSEPPSVFETIARTIWSHITPSADVLLDLHNASILSVPFIIRDRVLYDGDGDRSRAESLAARLDDLARAFGLSVVNEATPEKYVKRELHRSVAGAAVNEAGIPALTLELGMGISVDWSAVEAAVQGIENTLVWAGMVDGEIRQPTGVRIVAPGFPTREDDSVRARATGIVEPLLMPGDDFAAGDVLARLVDLWGRPIAESEMRAGADGWLVGWNNNLLKYPGERVALLAIRDDTPLIASWPDTK